MARGSNTGLIVVGLGAAAYYAYTQGWLSSLSSLFGTSAAPTGPTAGAPVGPSTTPYVLPSNLSAAPLPLQATILANTPAPAPTSAQVAAAEAGNGLAAMIAAKMKSQGAPQSAIDAAISSLLQSTATTSAGSIAGLGHAGLGRTRNPGGNYVRVN